jgi:hypothetical protein
MFKKEEDDPDVRKKLLHKFEKSDSHMPIISSEDERSDRPQHFLGKHQKTISQERTQRQVSPFFKNSMIESSYIESDSSILMINKQVDEIKKKSNKVVKK